MGTLLIAYRNHADQAVFSGGAWTAELPAANLADRQPSRVARTLTSTPDDTVADLDFGGARPVRFVALVRHNLTQAGRWRLRLAADPAFAEPIHDSGWTAIWPAVTPFGVGVWGEFHWGGRLSAEEAATYGIAAIHVLPVPAIARYLRLELADPGHPDGYLQAGRLVAGPAWQPRVNLQYGWSIEQVDDSRTVRSRGGQSYVDVQPKFRRLRFAFDYLERDEVFGQAYELERLKGVGGDLMVMVDPDDLQHRHRHTVYGVLAETAPIANPTPGRFAKTFTVDELL
ncbi:hypothetical protein GCM10017083_06970 [Thalassobaculum fulvum]|uniref:Uncharacterized protein n=1 Tax=Thalassobaculum fulvum TaxID=1633335 RepID=A0A918XNI2_9PROT|nr:hypothetical protein [Thalassobaculum fulvum]GHD42220.1 hypothetical protein GCM10017083_06970 [Thalassobaculum fulvum]